MAVSRIPRIILDGDEESASYMAREGIRQLGILKGLMSFGNLQQDIRKVEYIDGSRIVCRSCFGEDVVHIYAEKDEWAERELIPRFFAFIAKEDEETGAITTSYHWIYFNPDTVSLRDYRQTKNQNPVSIASGFEMYSWRAGDDVDYLKRMKNTPRGVTLHPHPHRNTKAFMMDGRTTEERDADLDEFGDPIDRPERWVSACHLLTKNRESMFMPLHAYTDSGNKQHGVAVDDYYCDILDSARYPDYPLPFPDSLFLAYKNNLLFTGLQFPVPPRHFYCNTEEGIMVWYGTNIDYAYDAGDYIGGIIYSRRTRCFHDFMIYPDEADGKGYETCYMLYYGNSELPQNLMADVQSLDGEYLKVAMSWNKRPIEYKLSLAAGNTNTQEITSVTHTRWVEDGTGFECQPFTEWTQYDVDPAPVEWNDSVPNPYTEGDTTPCAPRAAGVCPGFVGGETYNYAGGTKYGWADTKSIHSNQIWDLLGTDVKLIADNRRQYVTERCSNRIVLCLTVEGNLCGIDTSVYSKERKVQEILFQQENDDYRGYWVGNNVLGFKYRKHRVYMDAYAWTHASSHIPGAEIEGYFPQCYNENCDYPPTEDDFNARCTWSKHCPPDYIDDSGFTYPCFYTMEGDEMRGDDWVTIESDSIYHDSYTGFWAWLRESDIDSYDYTIQDEFNIDGEITFPFADVDNIYYLDDRATEDNQGLIAAGRGLSATALYTDDCLEVPEYKPDYWKVYWKVTWDDSSTEHVDITDQLLELLDCTAEELLDIGLI